jgi:hypothetical protein
MAFQTVHGLLVPGFQPVSGGVTIAFSSNTVDAAGEKLAGIFRVPKTGTISIVGVRSGAVTGSGDADVRLETVSLTDGNPTGTLVGTTTNGTVTINAANTWYNATLTLGAAVTRGDLIAVVVARTTGNYGISSLSNTPFGAQFPYIDHFTASWAKISTQPVFSLQYNDGSYGFTPSVYPYSLLTSTTYNSGSTPDERGLKFRLPAPVRVAGAWLYPDLDAAADIKLYDAADTELATLSLDPDVRIGTGYGSQYNWFGASVSLSANVYYRLTLLPTSVTDISAMHFNVNAAAVMDSLPGGQDFHHTERTNAGVWTDTTTQRPFIGLILDGIDDGVGGGGGQITHPGMAGGARG